MTITEPIAAPAWINVDALTGADVRGEALRLAIVFQNSIFDVEENVNAARVLLDRISAIHDEAAEQLTDLLAPRDLVQIVDGLHPLVMALTGGESLWNSMAALSEAVNPENVEGGPVNPAEVLGRYLVTTAEEVEG